MPSLTPSVVDTGSVSAATASTATPSALAAGAGTLVAAVAETVGTVLFPATTLYPSTALFPRSATHGFVAISPASGTLAPA